MYHKSSKRDSDKNDRCQFTPKWKLLFPGDFKTSFTNIIVGHCIRFSALYDGVLILTRTGGAKVVTPPDVINTRVPTLPQETTKRKQITIYKYCNIYLALIGQLMTARALFVIALRFPVRNRYHFFRRQPYLNDVDDRIRYN